MYAYTRKVLKDCSCYTLLFVYVVLLKCVISSPYFSGLLHLISLFSSEPMVHSVLWYSLKSHDSGSSINRGGWELQWCLTSGTYLLC